MLGGADALPEQPHPVLLSRANHLGFRAKNRETERVTLARTVVVGGLGTGTLTIQNGGVVSSGGGGSVGLSVGSIGTVTVTGPGSTWNNTPGGGLNIGSFGTGILTITNGGMVINNTAFTANIGEGAGSQGTVRVAGAGSTWSNSSGLNIGNRGAGTLTIAEGGLVTGPTVTIAANAGSTGTLNIGAGAGNPAAAPGTLTHRASYLAHGTATINFNHTSADYVFAPAISGGGTVNVLAGTTILTGANTYFGATNVNAGTLRAGAPNTFSSSAATTVASGGTLDLNGFGQTLDRLTNAGLVNMGTGTAPGTALFVTNYTGTGGTIAMNTFLGGDGSPSDTLGIRLTATGNTLLRITNAGGPGAETVADGIRVVRAIRAGVRRIPVPSRSSARCAAAPSTTISSGVASTLATVPTTGSCARASSSDRRSRACRRYHRSCQPTRRRRRCRRASIRSSGRRSRPMAWFSRSHGNWG